LDRYIIYFRRFDYYLLRVYITQKKRESREYDKKKTGIKRLINHIGKFIIDKIEENKKKNKI
jgi:predicted secreted protein